MKLLKMHADNFGRLQDFTFEFNDGLNTILEENGWGKSTMAAYLKAMLYGFENSSFSNDGDAQRKRYKPWQGGSFGGSLDFEIDGKAYRVTRSFGKDRLSDTVSVIDIATGEPAPFDAENLGEEIFHIDASAFERSVFIRQNSLLTDDSSASIQARLSSMISEANASRGFEKASSELDRRIRVYERADGRGEIDRLERALQEKADEKAEIQHSVTKQQELYGSLYSIADSIRKTETELRAETARHDEAVRNIQKRRSTAEMIGNLEADISSASNRQNDLKRDLGGSIPTTEEINRSRDVREALKKETEESASETAQKVSLYEKLTAIMGRYHNQLPSEIAIEEIVRTDRELQNIRYAGEQDDRHFKEIGIPEGFDAISGAVRQDPDFPGVLKETLSMQDMIRDQRTQEEIRASQINSETETWKTLQNGYQALHATLENAERKAKEMKNYAPEATKDDIRMLDELHDSKTAMEAEMEELAPLVEKEDDDYKAAKQKYAELHHRVMRLKKLTEQNVVYSPEQIDERVDQLTKLSELQNEVQERQDQMTRSALSDEEKKILEDYKGDLPESGSAKDITERLHTVRDKEDFREEQTIKLNAEKTKAADLTITLQTLDDEIAALPKPGAQPSMTPGLIIIIVGALMLAGGPFGAYMVRIELAALALVGIIMIVVGVVMLNRFQKATEIFKAATEEYNKQFSERKEKKKKASDDLDVVEKQIASLNGEIESAQKIIDTQGKEVRDWINKYGTDEKDLTDEVIRHIGEHTDQVRDLRKREDDLSKDAQFIREQNLNIGISQNKIANTYHETAGMNIEGMISFLNQGKDEYIKLLAKYKDASEEEEKFLDTCGFEVEVLDGTDKLLPSEAKTRYSELKGQLEEVAAHRSSINSKYEGLAQLDYEPAAQELTRRTETYSSLKEQAETARENVAQYLSNAGQTEESIRRPESARCAQLRTQQKESKAAYNKLFSLAKEVLSVIHLNVTEENLLSSLTQAETYYDSYVRYIEQKKDYETRTKQRRTDTIAKEEELHSRLAFLNGIYEELPLSERVARVRNDRMEAIHLAETIKNLDARIKTLDESRAEKQKTVRSFDNKYGVTLSGDAFAQIVSKSEEYRRLDDSLASLKSQLNGQQEKMATVPDNCDQEERDSAERMATLKERMEVMLVERTKAEARIREIDRALVKYPQVDRELRDLVQKKEAIVNDLRVLRKTLNLLRQAKENLSGRYYHRVEKLFNEYMQVWLNSDTIRGVVDEDLNVSIQENGRARSAEGYSAGYCDLIDFCMRMALVDTLFEGEKPFLILDDPFVNLDEDRLVGAIELLRAMAATRQVIYFVCHPSRAKASKTDVRRQEEFERIAGRTDELREALRRNRKDAVRSGDFGKARYIVDEAGVPFAPVDPQMVIRDTAIRISFELTEKVPYRNTAYELFFVDEEGAVVSDRKLLEICQGELVPSDVRFLMSLPEYTSGRVDLLIKEAATGEFEIGARLPFRVLLTGRN